MSFHWHYGFIGRPKRFVIKHTSFSLSYRLEAIISIKLEVHSYQNKHHNLKVNEELLHESLDLIDDKREDAELRVAAHQKRVARHFNTKVWSHTFR